MSADSIECLHCPNDASPGARYCPRCLTLNPPCAVATCSENAAPLRCLCQVHQGEWLESETLVVWLKERKA